MAFLRAFATLLEAQMPVAEALRSTADLTQNERLRTGIRRAEKSVRSGGAVGDALTSESLLPPSARHQIGVGEASGRLPGAVARIADESERAMKLQKKARSALAYPLFVCIVALAAVVFLLVVIVPTFAEMYAGFDADLPASTKRLMAISSALTDNWMIIIATFCVGGYAGARLLRVAAIRDALDRLLIRLPVAGALIKNRDAAGFSRSMQTLLQSGVTVESALATAAESVRNSLLRREILSAVDHVRVGKSLRDALGNSAHLPPLLVAMVAAGDTSGQLEKVFARAADYFENELETTLDTLVSLLEPAVILVLGSVLCWVLAALYLPMFEMASVVR